MTNVLLNVGTLIFAFGCLLELTFIIHYLLVAPAFKSLIGIMFVLRSVSFLFAGAAIIAGRVWGPNYAMRPYLTLSLFIAVLVSAVVTYTAFLITRYRGKDHPPSPHAFTLHSGLLEWIHARWSWIRARLRGNRRDDDDDGAGPHLRAVERRNA